MLRDSFKHFRLILGGIFISVCFIVANFAQSKPSLDKDVDLTGSYAGELKYPAGNLSGRATLRVEGNRFTLEPEKGEIKKGRITAVRTGGDYFSIALMFEEEEGKSAYPRVILSLRLTNANKHFRLINSPGETNAFLFETTTNARKTAGADLKLTETENKAQNSTADCSKPGANCAIKFATINADDSVRLENASNPDKKTTAKASANNSEKIKNETANNTIKTPVKTKKASGKNSLTKSKTAPPKEKSSTTVEAKNNKKPVRAETVRKTDKKTVVPTAKNDSEIQPENSRKAAFNNSAKTAENSDARLSEIRQATEDLRRATAELKAATAELNRARAASEKSNAKPSEKESNTATTEVKETPQPTKESGNKAGSAPEKSSPVKTSRKPKPTDSKRVKVGKKSPTR